MMTAGTPRNPNWTTAMDARLRKLWADGWTYTQIAEAMGLPSRSAVSGRAHRMGLTRRANPVKHETRMSLASAVARGKKPPVRLEKQPQGGRETDRRSELPARSAAVSEAILRPGTHCRWPTSDGRPWTFCEAECEHGFPYCPTHRARAYTAGTADGGQRKMIKGTQDQNVQTVRHRVAFVRAESKWGG